MNKFIDLTLIAILTAAILAFAWVGFIAADDRASSEAAMRWLTDGFYVGDTVWALRHPHVLGIAASYALFGFGEFQLILPAIIYLLLILVAVYVFLNRFAGRRAALAACVLLVLTPLMNAHATTASNDITEAFFVLLSIFLFWWAKESTTPLRILFCAGVAVGLGWVTRETSAGLILSYGLMFLAGSRYLRRDYLVMAAGAVSVVSVEMAYMTVMTGNPFYRYEIDLFRQATGVKDHASQVVNNVILPGVGEAVSSVPGNVSAHWLVDPFLSILFNQEFGLVFWVAVPIAVWLCFAQKVDRTHRDLARFLSLVAVVWFLVIAFGLSLREIPRYFMVSAVIAVILTGIWSANYWDVVSRKVLIAVVGGVIIANILGIYVENRNFLYGERAVAKLIAERGETVYTDKRTATLAITLLKLKHLPPEAVSSDPPPPGALFLYNPTNVAAGKVDKEKYDPAAFRPRQDWTQIWHDDPGRKISGIILEKTGLKQFIPEKIYAKLNYPNMPLSAYRVPASDTSKPDDMHGVE
jgi:4-amino-4-deoxy-L-arabinose transferase-like glycosyltransferase